MEELDSWLPRDVAGYNAEEKLEDDLEEGNPKNGWRQGKATRTTRSYDIEAVEIGGGEKSTLIASSAKSIACSSSSLKITCKIRQACCRATQP